MIISGAYTLYAYANVLIVGALLGTTAVGLYSAPFLLSVPLRYLGQSLAVSVAPRQVDRGKEPGSVEAFETSLRWMLVYQSALLAPLIVWADPIVELLFGPEFEESADVLRVLAFYVFLDGVSPLISNTVNYLGHAGRRIPIVVLALVINVGLDLALLPWIGVVGAAIGTSVAYALYVPAHFRICHRELGFNLRPLGVTLIRALMAALAMACVLFAVGTESLSASAWVLGGALGTTVFVSVLMLTGEIGLQDVRRGKQVVTAVIAGFRR
jgi:O-antigen/teichoic acid export membrane protein